MSIKRHAELLRIALEKADNEVREIIFTVEEAEEASEGEIRDALALWRLVEMAQEVWPGGSFVAINSDRVVAGDVTVTVTLRDKNGAYPLRSGVGESVAVAVAEADAWEGPFNRRTARDIAKELES